MAKTVIAGHGSRVKDLTGRRFGLLVVQGFYATNANRAGMWACLCDCGNYHVTEGRTLIRGHCRSCGCYKKARISAANKTHGGSTSSEYGIWASVNKRTSDPDNAAYPRYGGRGITMCAEWQNSYEQFIADMGPRPTNRHTLERKNNSLGYSKENCVWATYQEQARNRRSNRYLEFNGERMMVVQWAERFKIKDQIILKRLKSGWSIEKSLTETVREHKKGPRHFGREPEDFVTA